MNHTIRLAFFAGLVLAVAACHKESAAPVVEPPHIGLSLNLADQPLSTVQSGVAGAWKSHHSKGGIANAVSYPPDFFWTFSTGNRIRLSHNGVLYADTTLQWIKAPSQYARGDSSWFMRFYDKSGAYYFYYEANRIDNDTLVVNTTGPDAMAEYLVKR